MKEQRGRDVTTAVTLGLPKAEHADSFASPRTSPSLLWDKGLGITWNPQCQQALMPAQGLE